MGVGRDRGPSADVELLSGQGVDDNLQINKFIIIGIEARQWTIGHTKHTIDLIVGIKKIPKK